MRRIIPPRPSLWEQLRLLVGWSSKISHRKPSFLLVFQAVLYVVVPLLISFKLYMFINIVGGDGSNGIVDTAPTITTNLTIPNAFFETRNNISQTARRVLPKVVNFLHIPKAGGTTIEKISMVNGHRCGLWGSRMVGDKDLRRAHPWESGYWIRSVPVPEFHWNLLREKRGAGGLQKDEMVTGTSRKRNCSCPEWHIPIPWLPADVRTILYPHSLTFCSIRDPVERLLSFYYDTHWKDVCKNATASRMNELLKGDLTVALTEDPCLHMCHLLPQSTFFYKDHQDGSGRLPGQQGCDHSLTLGPSIGQQFERFMTTKTNCDIDALVGFKEGRAKNVMARRRCRNNQRSSPKKLVPSDLDEEVMGLVRRFYSDDFDLVSVSLPALPKVRISIVQISDDSSRSKLAHNIENLDCYARLQGYELISANIDSECQQRTSDIHFQRQCTVHKLMMSAANSTSGLNSEKQDNWFLVLDGDIAVINSNHRIEEYIEASNNKYNGDVIHGLRFHNNEVMAYCYLVKNSNFGREYIRSWAELYPEKYLNRLGNDDGRQLHYGGANSDNGALHWHLLHRLADDGVAGWEECLTAGQAANGSETDVTYGAFVTCFHDVVKQTQCNGRDWDRIDILPRGRHVAVDGWPFGWQFSDRSFMQHTIKNPPMRIPAAHSIYRPKFVRGRWPPPEFTCNHDNYDPYSYRVDKFYVNETYFSALVQWADDLQKKKHNNNPRSRDDSSCVQSGRGAVT